MSWVTLPLSYWQRASKNGKPSKKTLRSFLPEASRDSINLLLGWQQFKSDIAMWHRSNISGSTLHHSHRPLIDLVARSSYLMLIILDRNCPDRTEVVRDAVCSMTLSLSQEIILLLEKGSSPCSEGWLLFFFPPTQLSIWCIWIFFLFLGPVTHSQHSLVCGKRRIGLCVSNWKMHTFITEQLVIHSFIHFAYSFRWTSVYQT